MGLEDVFAAIGRFEVGRGEKQALRHTAVRAAAGGFGSQQEGPPCNEAIDDLEDILAAASQVVDTTLARPAALQMQLKDRNRRDLCNRVQRFAGRRHRAAHPEAVRILRAEVPEALAFLPSAATSDDSAVGDNATLSATISDTESELNTEAAQMAAEEAGRLRAAEEAEHFYIGEVDPDGDGQICGEEFVNAEPDDFSQRISYTETEQLVAKESRRTMKRNKTAKEKKGDSDARRHEAEKVVEVPQTQNLDKIVEVPQVQDEDTVRHEPKVMIQEVERDAAEAEEKVLQAELDEAQKKLKEMHMHLWASSPSTSRFDPASGQEHQEQPQGRPNRRAGAR